MHKHSPMKGYVWLKSTQSIGGVEICLRELAEIENLQLQFLNFTPPDILYSFFLLFKKHKSTDFILYCHWFGCVSSFFIWPLYINRRILLVSTSTVYTGMKSLLFYLSAILSTHIVFDSKNALEIYGPRFSKLANKKTYQKRFLPKRSIPAYPIGPSLDRQTNFVCVTRWSREKGIHNLNTLADLLDSNITVVTPSNVPNSHLFTRIDFIDGNCFKNVDYFFRNSHIHLSLGTDEGLSIVSFEALLRGCLPICLSQTETNRALAKVIGVNISSLNDIVYVSQLYLDMSLVKRDIILHELRTLTAPHIPIGTSFIEVLM